MRILRRMWWGSIIVALIAVGITCKANAQTPTTEYFPDTNQYVSGEFLSFYHSLPDPLLILGFPITGEIEDTTTGKRVQYFQMGRLELDPTAPEGRRVSISNLGWMMYTSGAPLAPISTDSPTCRYFPKNRVSVCYAFLQFYDAHGGKAVFGEPISSLEMMDQRMVQYFENARMEWRPEAQPGKRVGLANLGRLYYDKILQMGGAPGNGIPGQKPKPEVQQLKVNAFVKNALLSPNGSQTVYVIVQDQAFQPVHGAMIGVVVTQPDGRQAFYRPNHTDENGISIISFDTGQGNYKEMARVDVVATYAELEQRTSTWYRLWW